MKIKDRITLELTLRNKFKYETDYKWQKQYHTIYIMEDAEGQQFKWDTTGILAVESTDEDGFIKCQIPNLNDKFILKGTVKDFSEYKGIPQVVLTRCKCIEITHKAPTKEEIEEQKKQEQLASLQEGDHLWKRMPYKQYKEHYADCETLAGSFRYDHNKAYIDVIIRDGRLKASGVRGEHFYGFEFTSEEGQRVCYRAVSEENARKQMKKEFPESENWECTKIYRHRS